MDSDDVLMLGGSYGNAGGVCVVGCKMSSVSETKEACQVSANDYHNRPELSSSEVAAFLDDPNSGDVSWQATRLNTGDVDSGTITNSGSTVLPTNTTLIGPWGYRTNNATALAVGLDVMSAYVETDF